jgi:hypothetical protein
MREHLLLLKVKGPDHMSPERISTLVNAMLDVGYADALATKGSAFESEDSIDAAALTLMEPKVARPAIIAASRDHYVRLEDNPDDLPISVRDYEGASAELDHYDGDEEKFLKEFEDAAKQDEYGDWYIERGNQ